MINKNTYWMLFFVVTLAIICRFAFFNTLIHHPASKIDTSFPQMDMKGNLDWADTIVKGDFLSKNTWHPQHKWMLEIASMDHWYKWWGGKQKFQQTPLYPYFLACMLKITNYKLSSIKLIQHLIGVISTVLIFFITLELFGRNSSLISASIFAVYFPFLCFEFYFLRDFLALNFLLCFMLSFVYYFKHQKTIFLCLSSAFSALAFLTRENMLVLIIFTLIVVFFQKRSIKDILIKQFLVITIFVLVISPVLLRNFHLDVSVFSFSNRIIESLIEGNAIDSSTSYMCIPASMQKYLEEGDGKVFKTALLILKDYPSFLSFFKHGLQKIFSIFSVIEHYNNINLYYYFKEFVWLRFLPNYATICFTALIGAGIVFRSGKNYFLIALFLILTSSLFIGPALSRYRLIIVPFLIIFTSVLFDSILNSKIKNRKMLIYLLVCLMVFSGYFLGTKFIDEHTLSNVRFVDNYISNS